MTFLNLSQEQAKKAFMVQLDGYNEFGLRSVAEGILTYLLENTHESCASVDMSEVASIVLNGRRTND